MSKIELPSMQDMFRVAYIVQRGWEYEDIQEYWYKEGIFQSVERNYETYETEKFTLEQAYFHERY